MEIRELRLFVAVAEEGGLSPAARRLHLSQPALSQTIQALERELAVQLLLRSPSGTRLTEAGTVLLREARDLLAHHDRVIDAVAGSATAGVLRIGVPLELPDDLLPAALAQVRVAWPDLRVQVRHLSTATQIRDLREGRLDVAFVRERIPGPQFEAMLVVTERLGVLVAEELVDQLAEGDVVRLDALTGLRWIGFPREESPAWWDLIVAVLRSHGVTVDEPSDEKSLIAPVKLAAVQTGGAFALAPVALAKPLPDGLIWRALAGNPVVRRTWVAWPAGSRRRDIGAFVAALQPQQR